MKKLTVLLIALMCLCTAAQAETFAWNQNGPKEPFMEGLNVWFEAEPFAAQPPEELRRALDASPFAADPVLQGVLLRSYYMKLEGETNVLRSQAALLAVEHDGKPILLGAARNGLQWEIRPQSETFLREGEPFVITVLPNRPHNASEALLAIVYGEEAYLIFAGAPDEPWMLYQYQRSIDSGVTEALSLEYGAAAWCVYAEGKLKKQESFRCVLPDYLETLSADTLPRSLDELKAWAAAHPIELKAQEAYIGSVNLRQQATSSSRSYGKYPAGARVTLLGQKPGTDFPWYNVRIGDTEGWVSGVYFYTAELDATNLHHAANRLQSAARLKRTASLAKTPGGETVASLPAGTEVSVLVEQNGWAHVVVPRSELTWHADWDGTYGYLRLKDLTCAASPLQLRYTED